ncbi:alcohol dehydrogenase catalytic domain-containing protein [Nocardia thailandica]|uniref:alcohol dehydrogenase catalytic domain-containing protein n=1 Tax=Nocardia thailandica TaxID=257275 RepID=UPI0002D553CF|nr:alcohol dehydrogenase catalytic domain-containing protein [Nocardia thailandica]
MPQVVVFDRFGGPEVMHVVEEPAVAPAAGEVRVRMEAFAVNPLDLMMRSGASPAPITLPHARLGVEGTGTVDAVGPGVGGGEAPVTRSCSRPCRTRPSGAATPNT